jgi:hypothetical protein
VLAVEVRALNNLVCCGKNVSCMLIVTSVWCVRQAAAERSVLVFCATKKNVEACAELIARHLPAEMIADKVRAAAAFASICFVIA